MTLHICAPQRHRHTSLSFYRYGHRDALTCHKRTHIQIKLAIFVLPVDLVAGDGGAAWATDQQASREQRTDREERRKSITTGGEMYRRKNAAAES